MNSLSNARPTGAPAGSPASTFMYRESAEAAEAIRRQFDANRDAMAAAGRQLRKLQPRAVVTCARGSSDHAATFAKYLIETRTGVLTSSCAPSVSSIYRVPQRLNQCAFIAISQSGQSPDLVASARAAREAGATVISLVNQDDSPLAEVADIVLPLHAGPERSTAATKSYIASLFALAHLTAEWSQDQELLSALERAPSALQVAWQLDWSPAVPVLQSSRHLYVIGRGIGLGIAQEAALKCKETCRLHAEAFSGAEVRHGPQVLLDEAFPALMFVQDDESRRGLALLARELAQRGVRVMVAGEHVDGALSLPAVMAHPVLQPMLLIQSFYKLANEVSITRQCNPDQPPHLRKVTETH